MIWATIEEAGFCVLRRHREIHQQGLGETQRLHFAIEQQPHQALGFPWVARATCGEVSPVCDRKKKKVLETLRKAKGSG
jgi:hypothetical protein